MRFVALAIMMGGALVAAAKPAGVPADPHGQSVPAFDAAAIAAGKALVEKLECTRCHAATGMAAAQPKERSCAGCHAWIAATKHDPVERERQRERFPYWDTYIEHVDSFLAVPDLAAAGGRLDPAWVASYVRAPYAVRPGIYERMIRAPIDEAEAAQVAAFLASQRKPMSGVAAKAAAVAPSRSEVDVARGAALFAELRCGTCHSFGGRASIPTAYGESPKAYDGRGTGAPDLAHTRDRMRAADVAAYIADPTAFGGATAMPSFDLPPADAARLRDYILFAPLQQSGELAAAAAPKDLPLLLEEVTWRQVKERVLGRVCVHCHMDPEANAGEGGPGNTGGLGYEGKKLDLENWDAIRTSGVLAGVDGAEPALVARLRTRYAEHAREVAGRDAVAPSAEPPGMPMSMPPLSPEDFQLVRSWLAQGAPGPEGDLAVAPLDRQADFERRFRLGIAELTDEPCRITCAYIPGVSCGAPIDFSTLIRKGTK